MTQLSSLKNKEFSLLATNQIRLRFLSTPNTFRVYATRGWNSNAGGSFKSITGKIERMPDGTARIEISNPPSYFFVIMFVSMILMASKFLYQYLSKNGSDADIASFLGCVVVAPVMLGFAKGFGAAVRVDFEHFMKISPTDADNI